MKPTNIIKPLIIISFLLYYYSLSATEFSPKDKSVIYTEGISVLLQYENIINSIGNVSKNSIDQTKSYGESLNNLFINRKIMVFNDLDPKHTLSEFYEIETYTSNLILWYPDGIKIDLDIENVKSTDIIQHEENIFSIDLMVNKKIDGNYVNKSINRNTETLNFRIAFNKEGNDYKTFKIVGIRNAKSQTIIDDKKALDQVNSAGLSEEEIVKINQYIITALNDYQNFLYLLGDKHELEEDKEFYRESFKNIFGDINALVYNDLIANPDNPAITVKEYLQIYKENYPDGINNVALNIDSADFGTVIKKDNGTYYVNVYIDKFFSGNFKGKELHRFASQLIFKINFEKSGNSYKNFTIESVDVASMDFYAGSEQQKIPEPSISIKPISRKGMFIGVNLPVGFSVIKDLNLVSMTVENNYHNWNSENSISYYNGGIEIGYYFNNSLGVGSGVTYNTYSSSYNLNGEFEDPNSSLDINSEVFYKNVSANNYDSIINFNQICVPLIIRINTSEPKKFGLYVNTGINVSYIINSSYSVSGDFRYFGYYPTHPEVIQEIDLQELGYIKRLDIDKSGKINKINKINVSYIFQTGISIPINYFSNVYIGPYIELGISNLNTNDKYIDVFGNQFESERITFKKYGIQLSFNTKL